jgi:acyl-coenzyme A thioesterase PaaI-like protein
MSTATSTYRAWQRLSPHPGGTRLFSFAAMASVPYFASVLPHVRRMEPGLAEVDVPKWFFVHNHLRTAHAIASCNAAEMAMGMLMEATVPSSHRWIQKGMTVAYVQKADTSLRAIARLDPPDFRLVTEGTELVVPVSVCDRAGREVVHAEITTWVTPRSPRSAEPPRGAHDGLPADHSPGLR